VQKRAPARAAGDHGESVGRARHELRRTAPMSEDCGQRAKGGAIAAVAFEGSKSVHSPGVCIRTWSGSAAEAEDTRERKDL